MNKGIQQNRGYYIVQMWAASFMLAFFALERPINKLLDVIRQAGIISISASSLKENKDLVIMAIVPVFIKWIIVFFVWLAVYLSLFFYQKKNDEIFRKLESFFVQGKVKDLLFYIGVWIEMLWAAFFYASFQIPFATLLVFAAMLCFTTRLFLLDFSDRQWTWIALLVCFGICCELYTTRAFVLRAVLVILASYGIDWKKIGKWYVMVNVFSYALIAIVSALGISGMWMEADVFRDFETVANRYSFGFNSPNTSHYLIIKILLVAMYVWWEKIKLWHIVVAAAINYIMYLFTDSRTGMVIGMLACLMVAFFQYASKIRDWKIWTILSVVAVLFLAAFSLHFLQWDFYQYDVLRICPDYVYAINGKIVGRIHQALKYTQGIEISPFGTFKQGVYCDMGYIKFFYQEGFVAFGLYLFAVIKMLLWQHREKDYASFVIIVVISLRMFMESSFVPFVFINVILFLLLGRWNMIFGKRKDNEM